MKMITILMCAGLLLGCASTGNVAIKEETEQTMQTKIIEGKTTKSEVRKMFGAPLNTTFTDGGNEIYRYSFSQTKAKGINFIPVVSMFKSGQRGTEKNLTIMFDDNGIVKRYSLDESAIDTSVGILK